MVNLVQYRILAIIILMMKRNSKNIPFKRGTSYAFVVDGDCERWYIQMIKKNVPEFAANVKPELQQKKSLDEQFDSVLELSESYDKVFWIIDLDVIIRETKKARKGEETPIKKLENYLKRIENDSLKIETIINTPCLEFWFLLHFKNTSKYYESCTDIEKQFKKISVLKDYEKTEKYYIRLKTDIFSRLKEHLGCAITNAESISVFSFNNYEKGISQMYKLFDLKELLHLKPTHKNSH